MAKSIEFGCSKCDRMFNSMVELQVHESEHLNAKQKVPDQPVVTEVVKAPKDPITLTYVYKGNCPVCSQAVTTLELDVDKKHFAIAMCTKCNKQHATREVVKL